MIRQHNQEKADILNELRYLRRVQNPLAHEGIRYEQKKDEKIRSTLDDEVVRKGMQLEGIEVRSIILNIY